MDMCELELFNEPFLLLPCLVKIVNGQLQETWSSKGKTSKDSDHTGMKHIPSKSIFLTAALVKIDEQLVKMAEKENDDYQGQLQQWDLKHASLILVY